MVAKHHLVTRRQFVRATALSLQRRRYADSTSTEQRGRLLRLSAKAAQIRIRRGKCSYFKAKGAHVVIVVPAFEESPLDAE